MSNLHYFHRYSQKENVVTNNTLLLLSRLYAHSALYFEAFLADLLGADAPGVGVRFTQQDAGSKESIPDGVLEQRSFKIVLETKLHSKPEQDQLVRHLQSFGNEERQILLVLTPTRPEKNRQRELETSVKAYNDKQGLHVEPVFTTFRQLIYSYGGALAAHDTEMQYLLDDYTDFCATFGKDQLLPRDEYTLRAVPCGKTFEDNIDLRLYYQPVDRSSRNHKYLGIYRDKLVRYIGEIQKVVSADLIDGKILSKEPDIEEDEKRRIKDAIDRSHGVPGYQVDTGHEFYLVKEFYETSFEKVSPGGLQNQRYFDLADELGLDDRDTLPHVDEVAKRLRGRTWR